MPEPEQRRHAVSIVNLDGVGREIERYKREREEEMGKEQGGMSIVHRHGNT
jgi:hypothetical protein